MRDAVPPGATARAIGKSTADQLGGDGLEELDPEAVIRGGGAIEDPDDRVLGGAHQTAVHPPSTASTWPVT